MEEVGGSPGRKLAARRSHGTFDRYPIVLLVGCVRKRIAADQRRGAAASRWQLQLKCQELPRLKWRQRQAILRPEVEGADRLPCVFHLLLYDLKAAQALPGRCKCFQFVAGLQRLHRNAQIHGAAAQRQVVQPVLPEAIAEKNDQLQQDAAYDPQQKRKGVHFANVSNTNQFGLRFLSKFLTGHLLLIYVTEPRLSREICLNRHPAAVGN